MVGNALLAPVLARQTKTADPEKERVAKLNADYNRAVSSGNWYDAAQLLNAFTPEDILARLKKLSHVQLQALMLGALYSKTGAKDAVTKPIEVLDSEAARVGKLTFDYETAVAA